jgi:putative transposase
MWLQALKARPRRRRLPPDLGERQAAAVASNVLDRSFDALVMAIWRRGKPDALLHHSDRGSQYTSEQFQRLMADHGVVRSMSRSGNVWDNAAMESFFSRRRPSVQHASSIEPETKRRLMCSTTSNASTIQNAGIRRLDI